jgi:alpha-glucosidase
MIRQALLLSALLASPALSAVRPTNLQSSVLPIRSRVVMRPDGMDVWSGRRLTRVTALAVGAIRVRIGLEGQLGEDASWAVLPEARQATAPVTPLTWGFAGAGLVVTVDPATGGLTVADTAGHVLLKDIDAPARRTATGGGAGFQLAKAMPANWRYFGLGDKTGPLDRRGGSFVTWNSDSPFQETTDPLYKSIPFVIPVGPDGTAAGLFLDNSWRGFFDFGKGQSDTLRFGADGGPIDYYVLAGPTVKDVVQRYARLTGPSPLPPLWALGFQQSRWSYMSADEVRGIAQHYRQDHIPLDALWLDIDYQDRNRPFTVNTKTFPDMAGLVSDLKQQGIRTVAITDLHIAFAPNQGYAPYDTGFVGDHFVKKADGVLYVGPVWPGPAVFPDFTRASTRDWWGGLYKDFVADGIAGFWNDMNEPAVFNTPSKTMPLSNLHRIEEPGFATRTATHAEIHNIFGMENSRATHDGLLKLRPDERPYVLTRASFAGGQRYAATWTGDNSSTWNQLRMTVPMLLNLGMSGFAWSGADVGGFLGTPSADLLTRWIEIGAFQPIFRDHSAKDTAYQEPWVHGPVHEAIRRRFIEERYRLMPYFYAVADETARTGLPMMRPVFMDYPDALDTDCPSDMVFTVGGKLLVAPPPQPESPGWYDVCLPKGGWFDYWTGKPATPRMRGTRQVVQEKPALDQLPVYVRAGTILPRQPLVQSTMETPIGALELAVYPGDGCAGTLYADDGHSLGYQRGAYLRQTVRCSVTPTGLELRFDKRDGSYKPWWHDIDVVIHGWNGPAPTATLDDKPVPATADATAATLTVRIPDRRDVSLLRLVRTASDH